MKNQNIDIKKVERFAIAKGEFSVTMGGETRSWPVKDLDSLAASSCAYCSDFTGMNSDISCGNVGSDDGWTTVIVRSKRAEVILKDAIKEGVIEAEEMDDKAVQAVINSARFKMNKRYTLQSAH